MNGKTRILLVDDHHGTRQGLRSVLSRQPGFEVSGDGDGKHGVELASKLQPDVVIIDLQMLTFTAVDATRQITEAHPKTRVICLAPHLDNHLMQEALQAGAHGYVLKTDTYEQLNEAIRTVLSGKIFLGAGLTESAASGSDGDGRDSDGDGRGLHGAARSSDGDGHGAARNSDGDGHGLHGAARGSDGDGRGSDGAARALLSTAPGSDGAAHGSDGAERGPNGLSRRELEVVKLIAEGFSTKQIAAQLHISAKTVETHRRNLMEKLKIDSVAELTKYAIREGISPL